MPRYNFLCSQCYETIEVVRSMADCNGPVTCSCGTIMDRDFKTEGVLVGAGKRSYHRPIVSDSLAINPEQIPEHKEMFPDIKVTSEGQPVFDNYSDHEAYLKKCNIEKIPQKKRKRGKRIA